VRVVRYLLHRFLFILPQLLGIVLVSFLLVKSIPGDPAVLMLGPTATPDAIASLRTQMGLDQPLYMQFILYVTHLLHGDLGTSWQTTRPVLDDLIQRFPATLELVTYSLILAIAVGMGLGIASALNPKGWVGRLADVYGLSAGALPDFWFALVLIFVFYTLAHWAPPPLGRLDIEVIAPTPISGFMTIDTLLAGDMEAFRSAASHLILPVLTLGLINAGPIMKMTQSSMVKMLGSDASRYEMLCGIPQRLVSRHALRNALPSIVTIISVLYGYLIGGAVLVEIVFSWGGAGQYAVQGVLNSDIYPVLGFVLFSAVFSLIVYIAVDLVYVLIDPRISH
jgi:ABC-type dipeptide/oligopeptide/nickel transport system permease component